MVERIPVDNSIEHKIITGLIVSDQFCRRMLPVLHNKFFLTEYTAKIFDWCKQYFTKYQVAPKKQIADLYMVNRETVDADQQQLIESFLHTISSKYETDEFN